MRTPKASRSRYAVALIALLAAPATVSQNLTRTGCHPVASAILPPYDFEAAKHQPQQLHIDACSVGIVLAAYEKDAPKPTISISTFDLFVEQLAMIGRTIAIVTGGGTTSRLWVLDFSGNSPSVKYKGTTKEAVSIHTKEPSEVLIDFCPIEQACTQLRFGSDRVAPR